MSIYAYTANEGGSTVTKINLSTFTAVGSALAVGAGLAPYSIACDRASVNNGSFLALMGASM